MTRARTIFFALAAVVPPAVAQFSPLPSSDADRIRAARSLAAAVGDSVWPGWHTAPFTMLLITPSTEYLVASSSPPGGDFSVVPGDTLLGAAVYERKRTFPEAMQATFPLVNGVNTIVIGEAEHTSDKTATRWILTVLHEHFHQWVYSQPWYYPGVAKLGLDHGDKTGMWMLNYPFPYDSAAVGARYTAMAHALREALSADGDSFPAALAEFRRARAAFTASVPDEARRYFDFQLWQEGVARYTEVKLASLAMAHHDGSAITLDPAYAKVLADLMLRVHGDLDSLTLAKDRRIVVYSFGAAQALLLDRTKPGWREGYFTQPFKLPEP